MNVIQNHMANSLKNRRNSRHTNCILSVWIFIILIAAGCTAEPISLIEAASKGDIDTVRTLLAKGADVNAEDNDGNTALMASAKNGHTNIVQVLLKQGADVNAKTKSGETALMIAKKMGHEEIVLIFKEAGAKE